MDHKRDTDKEQESSTGKSSPRSSGAYYSLEPKRSQNYFKAWAGVGLIVMILAGGGYFASKKMVTEPEQDSISIHSTMLIMPWLPVVSPDQWYLM